MFISASTDLRVHSQTGPEKFEAQALPTPSTGAPIAQVALCNDNTYLAIVRESHDRPQILSIKQRLNARLVHTIQVQGATCLAFKRSTKRNVAIGTVTGDVHLYDTNQRKIQMTYLKAEPCPIRAVHFTDKDKELLAIGANQLWVCAGASCRQMTLQGECLTLTSAAHLAIVGLRTGKIAVINVQTLEIMTKYELYRNEVSNVGVTSCGQILVVTSGNNLKMVEVNLEKRDIVGCRFAIEYEVPITCLTISPDDHFLAIGLGNGVVKVFDMKQLMKQVYCDKVHKGPVTHMVYENKMIENVYGGGSVSDEASTVSMQRMEGASEAGEVMLARDMSVMRVNGFQDESMERFKKTIMKMVKHEMDALEVQLQEHCIKFQKFLDNEFETIDNTLRNKGDIWNVLAGENGGQMLKNFYPDEHHQRNE